ncbi:MAG: NAD(P)H-hydrate dehydratase [Coriobacteriaceae bacterium]|nr:NAD(P)H-hydrate dehydratase [Coriobacteriaceae bacterium]
MDSTRAVERSEQDYAALVPHPRPDTNKYDRGVCLIIAGSASYPGAAALCSAASRCGAGYVRLCTPASAAEAARAHLASVPVTACAEEAGTFCLESLADIEPYLSRADAIVCGPGWTDTPAVEAFCAELIGCIEAPVLLDADALNVTAADPDLLRSCPSQVRVLTPHAKEAERLLGRPLDDSVADGEELARTFAATVIMKGADSYIIDSAQAPIGFFDGTAALAKAGTGDVLAGMVGALLSQGLSAVDAASLGVFLHARAASLAAERLSDVSVMPEDVIESVGPAILGLKG